MATKAIVFRLAMLSLVFAALFALHEATGNQTNDTQNNSAGKIDVADAVHARDHDAIKGSKLNIPICRRSECTDDKTCWCCMFEQSCWTDQPTCEKSCPKPVSTKGLPPL
ncbi:hypothetical protein CIPAW_01G028600 [Carya illinoinensis]|uniref:Uncharacterized protein n=1 Tax=Carya illinoinensis TaxID=32201 RepID=A0A8T1RFU5_CARIL|nr:hypothetical protein CIPAW_01G028600 [Carya illinoinensis]